ncbi:type VII secretion-associated protein [Mycobacterium sp. NPDC048908]|uniref:type VII secretion-associated protein n=1 Tax=Mycobacterium sp. NPDC048908 TaxID=3364292 RepID=UPI003720BE46
MDRAAAMTTVVEVGPATVRGPYPAEPQLVSAALEGIDDQLVLIDDHPADVADVWRTIMSDVVGEAVDSVVLVFPTWWSSARVQRVSGVAKALAGDVIAMRRAQVLRDHRSLLVELGPEFFVVSSSTGVVAVVSHGDVEMLVASTRMCTAVVVDDSEDAGPQTASIADRLRAAGVAVTVAETGWVSASIAQKGPDAPEPPPKKKRAVTAVLAGVLVSAAALCGGYIASPSAHPPSSALPTTLLVEGRLGVMVPAQWAVQRVTSGPGSSRVQIVSPEDDAVAMHLTQSRLAPQQSGQDVEHALRRALDETPDGVFVGFDPAGSRADRDVLTYREIRAGRHIQWFVFVDGSLRIAIGCQSAPGRDQAVREPCDQAIRSAHAVF